MRQWRMKSNFSMPISCNLISFADCLLLPIQRHPLLGGPPEYVEEQRQLVFRVYPLPTYVGRLCQTHHRGRSLSCPFRDLMYTVIASVIAHFIHGVAWQSSTPGRMLQFFSSPAPPVSPLHPFRAWHFLFMDCALVFLWSLGLNELPPAVITRALSVMLLPDANSVHKIYATSLKYS